MYDDSEILYKNLKKEDEYCAPLKVRFQQVH